MSQTVGDFLFQRLSQWGVKRIFGYPGDGINGIMGALGRAGDRSGDPDSRGVTRQSIKQMAAGVLHKSEDCW